MKLTCLDELVPSDHLLRKIDKVINFDKVYSTVEHLYCDDNEHPVTNPVVLVKMVLLKAGNVEDIG